MRLRAVVVAALAVSCSETTHDNRVAVAPAPSRDRVIEQRVTSLLAKMTLDEKIGQLNQYAYGELSGVGTERGPIEATIVSGQVGSLIMVGAKDINRLQRIAVEQSRLHIPLLIGFDVIHGYRTIFPVPLALASTWDPDLVQRAAAVAAREAAVDGVRWTFSPMVDIGRDPRWGRVVEGAGEDPFLTSMMGEAFVRGYQGNQLSDPTSIAACTKHYVGYGAAEAGRDYNATNFGERELRNVYLPPFKAAVDRGVASVMTAFNTIDGVPASANAFTLNILKKEWGFRGLVVSDWNSVGESIAHGVAIDHSTAARKSLVAGVDMEMESATYLKELAGLVKAGKVRVSVIDESVRRVLRLKVALGLFEHPYADEAAAAAALDPAAIELAKQAAQASFVLLKNGEPGAAPTLPISPTVRRVAVIGPLADDAENMLGSWTAVGDPKAVVTLRAALATDRRFEVVYERGVEISGGSEAGIDAAVRAARESDLILLAVGEHGVQMTGEATSRARLDLPGHQPKLLDALTKLGKPIVMIVFARPLTLTPYLAHASAIIQAWHPGIQAGPALVDVLTGTASFSGRLTVSLPRSLGQLPLYYNTLATGKPAGAIDLAKPMTDADRYLSRYIDEDNAPLFPFGYGLTYTQFEYGPVTPSTTSLSAKALDRGGPGVTVRATIKNVGARDGVETVQLYIRLRGTSIARPVRELKGFQRVSLRAGEAREVTFTLAREQLAFWNIDKKRVVEPSALTIWVAPDARSGAPLQVTIAE